MDRIARKLLDTVQEMVSGRFEVRAASRETHPHLSWSDYDDARRRLEQLGYRWLGDVEVLSYHEEPRAMHPPAFRMLVSADGTVAAGFYRVPLRWTRLGIIWRLMRMGAPMLNLSTGFPDGTVVETTTVPLSGKWTTPPFLLRAFYPKVSLEALVAFHAERVAEHRERHPGLTPLRISSLEEFVAAADGFDRRKREHRQSIGWITYEELGRFGVEDAKRRELLAAIRRFAPDPQGTAPSGFHPRPDR